MLPPLAADSSAGIAFVDYGDAGTLCTTGMLALSVYRLSVVQTSYLLPLLQRVLLSWPFGLQLATRGLRCHR